MLFLWYYCWNMLNITTSSCIFVLDGILKTILLFRITLLNHLLLRCSECLLMYLFLKNIKLVFLVALICLFVEFLDIRSVFIKLLRWLHLLQIWQKLLFGFFLDFSAPNGLSKNQRFVVLSQQWLGSIIINIIKFLRKFNGFDEVFLELGYRNFRFVVEWIEFIKI